MSNFNERLNPIWKDSKSPILVDETKSLNYDEFIAELNIYSSKLQQLNVSSVALIADNCIEWLLIDLACQQLNITFLPIPCYFSLEQTRHAIRQSGCELLIVDQQNTTNNVSFAALEACERFQTFNFFYLADAIKGNMPQGTHKITYTSGSTGAPKGVCLTSEHQWQVASAIVESIALPASTHLCLMPLAVLLENVAGVYAAMLNGSTVVLKPLQELGFNGSSTLEPKQFIRQISAVKPGTLITTPQLLNLLVIAAENGWQAPQTLRFIAVGGARVSKTLLLKAHAIGLPVYQGYGLSECASVVSLNSIATNKVGSAGKPLSHQTITIENNEIVINGSIFLGYIGDTSSWNQSRYKTGDLGYLDSSGNILIDGRKKNIMISSYGRNISPEWLEAELIADGSIKQAFVFGDNKPYCVAAIIAQDYSMSSAQLQLKIKEINCRLPDYARIKNWFRVYEELDSASGLITANGRPKRRQLEQYFFNEIKSLYQDEASSFTDYVTEYVTDNATDHVMEN